MEYCFECMRERQPGETVCPVCGYRHAAEQQNNQVLPPGSILHAGKYLVGKAIGQGGFGITYVGRDNVLNMKVAIKEYYPRSTACRSKERTTLIWPNEKTRDVGRESFIREAQMLANTNGIPHVARVREVFYENETAYIVMDFIDGETLFEHLKKNGAMKEEKCLALLLPVIKALEEAHRLGMIHQDVSPDNIMLDQRGLPWLLDMGAARDLGTVGGNPAGNQYRRGFSPPEQYAQNQEIGPWTDVYAMCATIFYCLTGKPVPESPDRLMKDTLTFPNTMSRKIRQILEKGLAPLVKDRIQTMGDLHDLVDKFLKHRRNRRRMVAAAAAILALACGAIFATKQIETPVEDIYQAALEAYNDNNYEQAAELFTKAANRGNGEAAFYLGYCNERGYGMEAPDYAAAVKWYTKAADQGILAAKNNLSILYHDGKGVEKDLEKSLKLRTEAASQGNRSSQYLLGMNYYNGDGMEQNYEKAVEWLTKAAEQGYTSAQYYLGRCCENGYGTEQNYLSALSWYQKASDSGDSRAMFSIGCLFWNGHVDGTTNYAGAKQYFEKATAAGHSEAMYWLGVIYENGYSVKQDSETALAWYTKAANLGVQKAQDALSRLSAS